MTFSLTATGLGLLQRFSQTKKTQPSERTTCQNCALVFLTSFSSRPPWRNRLARSAVNRKVGGSSPPGGEMFCKFCQQVNFVCIFYIKYKCLDILFFGIASVLAVIYTDEQLRGIMRKKSLFNIREHGSSNNLLKSATKLTEFGLIISNLESGRFPCSQCG